MKKSVLITVLVLLMGAGIGVGIWFVLSGSRNSTDQTPVYADSVIALTNRIEAQNRYSGVAETQEIKKVQKDNVKKIKEILVSEGDEVQVGTPLFSYDTEEIELNVQKGELELERIENDITSMKNQIRELESERTRAEEADKFSYTVQIQSLENDISRQEYNIKVKELELDEMQKSVDNAVVLSETDGVIQTINENAQGDTSTQISSNTGDTASAGSSDSNAFITILPSGDLRIKGTVNEMNVTSLKEGDGVILYSRVDSSQTWKGVVSKIDLENVQSGGSQSDFYYASGSSSNRSSSSYAFYISLLSSSNTEGGVELIPGQHVWIEPDNGQTDAADGIWIPEDYILNLNGTEENEPYVWIVNAQDNIEKRTIVLGASLPELNKYEVVEGLSEGDFIAYPVGSIQEGMKAVKIFQEKTSNEAEESSGEGLTEYDESAEAESSDEQTSEIATTTAEETTETETTTTLEQTLPPIGGGSNRQNVASMGSILRGIWNSFMGKGAVK